MKAAAKKEKAYRDIPDSKNENVVAESITEYRTMTPPVRKKTSPVKQMTPPEGFVTGDEFERQVKARLKQLYKDHGLL